MKILLLSRFFHPENFRVNDLVSGLRELDHDVTVVTDIPSYPGGTIYPEFRNWRLEKRDYKGAEVRYLPNVTRGTSKIRLLIGHLLFPVIATLYLLRLRLAGERYDLLFMINLTPVTDCLPGIAASRLMKIPMVLWVLDIFPEQMKVSDAITGKLIYSVIARISDYLYARATILLGQSDMMVDVLKKRFPDHEGVYPLYDWAEGIFEREWSGAELRELRDNNDLPDLNGSGEQVLFSGNLGGGQGLSLIIEGLSSIDPEHRPTLHLVGEGNARALLEDLVVELGVAPWVRFHGSFNLDCMPWFLSRADFLFVSLKPDAGCHLTIPGKIQSYLTFGKPVMGILEHGAARQLIEESASGLIADPGDREAIIEMLAGLREISPEERRAYSRSAREYYRTHLTRDTALRRLEDHMDRALSIHRT